MMKTPFKTFRPCRRPVLWVLFAILVSIQPLWQQQVDSLERVLNRPDITTEDKIHTLYMLSRDLAFVDRLQALEYADESLELATQAEDRRGMAYAYRILGSIYSLDENYFTSMQYIHLAHELFVQQEDSAGIANCYVSMGHIYRNLNERQQIVAPAPRKAAQAKSEGRGMGQTASSSSINPLITPRPLDQKAGSDASRLNGASNSL